MYIYVLYNFLLDFRQPGGARRSCLMNAIARASLVLNIKKGAVKAPFHS